MRHSRARCSGSEASRHSHSSADCITTTCESEFSVHTGIADVGMRILADQLTGRLKQQFVVENRPGAGGIVAAKAVASAAPDGYTVLMTGNNNAISASLFKSLPYNILTDFASTSTTSFFDLLIVTRAGSPLQSVEDIVKMARVNPGRLNIAPSIPGVPRASAWRCRCRLRVLCRNTRAD